MILQMAQAGRQSGLDSMPVVQRTIGAVRARERMRRGVKAAWMWGVGGSVCSVAMVIALARMGEAWAVEWPVAMGVPLAGAVVGAMLAMVRPVSSQWAAAAIDRSFGLNDRLRSAIEVGGRSGADPFVAILLRESEREAARVRPERVVSVRFGRGWLAFVLVAAGASVLPLVMPVADRAAAAARRAEATAEQTRAREAVASTAAVVRERASAMAPDASARELARFDEIERELAEGTTTPDEAIARTASVAEELATRAERDASDAIDTDRRLRELLSSLKGREGEDERGGPTFVDEGMERGERDLWDLQERLARGDLEAAEAMARELAERVEGLTPDEREAIASRLEALADEMERVSRGVSGAQSQDERSDVPGMDGAGGREGADGPAGEASAEGTGETAGQGENGGDVAGERAGEREGDAGASSDGPAGPDALPSVEERAQELESKGVDPIRAREMATRADEEARRTRAEEQARRDAEELAARARDAARELREPPAAPGATPPERGQDPAASEPGSPPSSTTPPSTTPPSTTRPSTTPPGTTPPSTPPASSEASERSQGAESAEGQDREGEARSEGRDGERQGAGERQGESQESRESGREERGGQSAGDEGREQTEGAAEDGAAEDGASGRGVDEQGAGRGGTEERREGASESGAEGGDRAAERPGQPAQGSEQRQPGSGQEPGGRPAERGGQQGGEQGREGTEERGGASEGEDGAANGAERGSRQGAGEQPQGGGSAVERFRESLERMAERRGGAERSREFAERMREQAERVGSRDGERPEGLAGREGEGEPGMMPGRGDGREARGERGIGEGAGPRRDGSPWRGPEGSPGATETETVEGPRGGGTGEGGRVVAERPSTGEGPVVVPPVTGARVREAAAGAERAIEQQVVPARRSDLVRRVFRRYTERAAEEGGGLGVGSGGGGGGGGE